MSLFNVPCSSKDCHAVVVVRVHAADDFVPSYCPICGADAQAEEVGE